NPDDHKVCGPEPRPAPANAIIFSGVGRFKKFVNSDNNGVGNQTWVVFRVYIEDRSEPGGRHPGGAVEPPDIYCFEAWALPGSQTDFDNDLAKALRTAVAAQGCAFITGHAPGTLPPTSV